MGENIDTMQTDEEEMEFNPVLYLRKDELPSGTKLMQIVNKLEQVYGFKSCFRVYEFGKYFHVGFPNKVVAKKAFGDSLDFGQNVIVHFYDSYNHGVWLDSL